MDHLRWWMVDWAVRRRNQTETGAKSFANWAADRYDGNNNICELFEQYKLEKWSTN